MFPPALPFATAPGRKLGQRRFATRPLTTASGRTHRVRRGACGAKQVRGGDSTVCFMRFATVYTAVRRRARVVDEAVNYLLGSATLILTFQD
ncbi:unnamed protein product, partial [Mycena citricolor]